jgi:hypothetical protein
MTTITIPIDVAEAAAEALGNFVSDHGWSDSDMQAMDNLDAYIARHRANQAARANLRAERKPMIAADIDAEARKAGASAYTNRFVAGSAFSFGPEALERFVRAVEAHHGIGEQS